MTKLVGSYVIFQARSSGKRFCASVIRVAHLLQRGDRIGARRLINRHRGRRPAVQSRFAVEIGGAQIHPGDVAQAQHRSVGIGAHDDVLEVGDGIQPALGLDVELQLLVIRDRPGTDASNSSLNVLRLDRIDNVAGRKTETGQPVGPDPGTHGIVLRSPQRRVPDAGRALDLVEQIDGDVVGNIQRVMGMLGRVDRDHTKQRRRLLFDGDALTLNVLQAGWRVPSAPDC